MLNIHTHEDLYPYYCPLCYKVLYRYEDKKWLASFCSAHGKDVRLRRIDENSLKKVLEKLVFSQ